jgi:hypothetical protein
MRALRWIALWSLLTGPAWAQDMNHDGIVDEITGPTPVENAVANIAIVNTGDGSVGNYQTRLVAMGHTVTVIPVNSTLGTLVLYQVVVLPTSHGSTSTYGVFQGLANDYHQYVQGGGCLYIGQPNPFDAPGQQAPIPWAPYALTVNANYNGADCPPTIVNPQLCETQGLLGSDLPFPADTITVLGPEWTILTRGPITNNPGALSAAFGGGHVVVDLGHPSTGSVCPYTNVGIDRLVTCCLPVATPVDTSTWGKVKATYE